MNSRPFTANAKPASGSSACVWAGLMPVGRAFDRHETLLRIPPGVRRA